jgi:hypothetical protein
VLSYVEGVAPIDPVPAVGARGLALRSVARLLRGYHDAVASFSPGARSWPTEIPAGYGPVLVSHNDPNLDNIVFRDGEAVGLIDFDLAAPARGSGTVRGRAPVVPAAAGRRRARLAAGPLPGAVAGLRGRVRLDAAERDLLLDAAGPEPRLDLRAHLVGGRCRAGRFANY